MRTELLVRTSQHDNDLMTILQGEIVALEKLEKELETDMAKQVQKKAELETKHRELEQSKNEIQATKLQLDTKRSQLEKEMNEAENELENLDKESDEYKALINKQEDELVALSKQMEEFIKNNGSSTSDKPSSDENKGDDANKGDGANSGSSGKNPYLTGSETVFSSGMIFPLKCSGVYISSPYGMRTHPTTGQYKLHTGTDFCASGINGKTVYAVKDGKVIYAAKHKAYGNFVIIDHGKGISSCYAHMQDGSMTVSVGDSVLQGQPIGKVGSTGYSTGPHLHFEIRVDGATTNPMKGYVKLPG
ncbi:MAG: peptidoglycan DD-metalloendopeptidase family protein, partial [Clostridia bacterium]|nr:peptidoglycan DD-metalloendopeptidase family protein [Clostridia bacterium]